ncbi:MAG: hypothetical protein ACPG05_00015 [Bdellovibrionales bacterium]
MIKKFVMISLVLALVVPFSVKRAQAFCFCTSCDCATLESLHSTTRSTVSTFLEETISYLITNYINSYLVRKHWWPGLQSFVEQTSMSSQKAMFDMAAMHSDARQQVLAMNLIAEQKLEAVMETKPDEETCKMASIGQGLSYSARMSKATHNAFKQQGFNRSLQLPGDPSFRGSSQERLMRFQQSAPRNFSPQDMNGALVDFAAGDDPNDIDADVSPNTLFGRGTLDIDISDADVSADEANIYLLKSNLYNNKTLTGFSAQDLMSPDNYDELDEMEMIAAFQALSEYSFDYIASMKALGDGSTAEILPAVLRELGASDAAIDGILGENDRPSYFQMLEILSRTMQMSPTTHTADMGEAPELLRRLTIKEGLELMIKFEIYQSHKRAAAMATALHELERRKLQKEWETQPIFVGGNG